MTYALSLAVGAASAAVVVFDQSRALVLGASSMRAPPVSTVSIVSNALRRVLAERDAVLGRLQLWRLLTHQLAFHQLRRLWL